MATVDPLREDHDPPVAQARVVQEPRNLTLDVLRAIAHPVRLELLAHIAARGPLCACHLERLVGCTQPQISKHIAVLRRAGVVDSRRDGRWVFYSVNEEALAAHPPKGVGGLLNYGQKA